MNLLINFVQN